MAESEDRASKTEEPTEKKIRDTVEKGNLPVSREAPILASFLATMAFIAFEARQAGSRLAESLETTFDNPLQWDLETSRDALHVLSVLATQSAAFVLPAAIFLAVGGILSSILQNPPQINFERIKPKASNVSPVSGASRIFGPKGLTEFGKAVFKFIMIGAVVGTVLVSNVSAIMQTMHSDPVLLPELILSLAMKLLRIDRDHPSGGGRHRNDPLSLAARPAHVQAGDQGRDEAVRGRSDGQAAPASDRP